jgi:hypothetical protein
MEKKIYGKKQYFILLAFSAIVTFLLPLIYNICIISVFWNHAISAYGPFYNFVNTYGMILGEVGLAVLAFSSMRFRFRLCLSFALVSIFSTFSLYITEYIILKNQISFPLYFFNLLISCVMPVIYIGVAKVSTKFVKREIAVVIVTFLGMYIASILKHLLSRELESILIKAPMHYPDSFSNYVFYKINETLVTLLYYYLYVVVAYFLIKLLFTENKRKKIRRIWSTIKVTSKKLWDLTAK